jgi:hypothetical protein
VCAGGGSCELSWTVGEDDKVGATTYQVRFLIDASSRSDELTPFVLAEARSFANMKLNNYFVYHPGFNVVGNDHLMKTLWRANYYSAFDVAHIPDTDGPVYAIAGIGLRMGPSDSSDAWLTTMHVYRRQVLDGGALGPDEVVRLGLEPDHGLERLVVLPAGYVATGFVVDGREAGDITHLAVRGRPMYANGTLGSERIFPEGASTSGDLSVTLSSGSYLTGVAFRSRDGQVPGYGYMSASGAPAWSRRVGGTGGMSYHLRCPAGMVAIGTAQNAPGATIGQFGIVCAARDRVEMGETIWPWSTWIAHGAQDLGTLYQAGVDSYVAYSASAPGGISRVTCDTGYALDGLQAHAGSLVDRIDFIHCLNVAKLPGKAGGYWQAVGVGGAGGVTKTSMCLNPVAGLYVHAGAVTDGFALECR